MISFAFVASRAVALVAGCSQAPSPTDTRKADEAAITAASDALGQAAEAKDLEKCMSFYVDDPVMIAADTNASDK